MENISSNMKLLCSSKLCALQTGYSKAKLLGRVLQFGFLQSAQNNIIGAMQNKQTYIYNSAMTL